MAEREGFDELVLGGGERSPSGKMRLGRAAEFAVLNAHTTVVLVR
jgi:nucleotide-binding universal stress UspA family protein